VFVESPAAPSFKVPSEIIVAPEKVLAPDKVKVFNPDFVIPTPELPLIIPDKITPPVLLIVSVLLAAPNDSAAAKVKAPVLVPSPKVTSPVYVIGLLIVLAVELSD